MMQKLEIESPPAKAGEIQVVVLDTPQSLQSIGRILNLKGDISSSLGSPSGSRGGSPTARVRRGSKGGSPTARQADKNYFEKFSGDKPPESYSPVQSPSRRREEEDNHGLQSVSTEVSGMTIPSLRPEMCVTPLMVAFQEKYEISQALGRGAFGQVSLATCLATGEKLAAKQVETEDRKTFELFQNEFEIAKRLKHPNIVKVCDMFVNDKICYLVMDLCTGGDLVQFIQNHEECLMSTRMYFPPPLDILARLLWQMLQSIRYIHHYEIVHRDIKMENFLLAQEDEDNPQVKLIDFGFAQTLKAGEVLSRRAGTAGYRAPEVLRGSGYGFPCDAWSMGVCAYMVFTGAFPIPLSKMEKHKSKDPKELLRQELLLTEEHQISYKESSFSIPKEGMDMLKKLLQKDPSARSSPKQILSSDKWLRSEGRGKSNCCCTVS